MLCNKVAGLHRSTPNLLTVLKVALHAVDAKSHRDIAAAASTVRPLRALCNVLICSARLDAPTLSGTPSIRNVVCEPTDSSLEDVFPRARNEGNISIADGSTFETTWKSRREFLLDIVCGCLAVEAASTSPRPSRNGLVATGTAILAPEQRLDEGEFDVRLLVALRTARLLKLGRTSNGRPRELVLWFKTDTEVEVGKAVPRVHDDVWGRVREAPHLKAACCERRHDNRRAYNNADHRHGTRETGTAARSTQDVSLNQNGYGGRESSI